MSVEIYPCVKNGLMATELPIAGATNPSTVELPGDTMRLLRTTTNYGYIYQPIALARPIVDNMPFALITCSVLQSLLINMNLDHWMSRLSVGARLILKHPDSCYSVERQN